MFQPFGKSLRMALMFSLSELTTSTVFVPDCLRTNITTAGFPSTLAIDSASATLSSMCATSPIFTT